MTHTMEVIAGQSVETRKVDHVELGPRNEPLLMPVLRDGEEVMRCIDGTVYVFRTHMPA